MDDITAKPRLQIKENIRTFANLITLTRVIVCCVLFYIAFTSQNSLWNYIGLGTHWTLDILDGYFARRMNQETLFGAQIDILSDRLLLMFFYMIFIHSHPNLLIPIILFLLQFVFLDAYLSLQFLNWDIISPNYFYRVDKRIWQLNWSPLAKSSNSGLITVMLSVVDAPMLITVFVLITLAIKIYSIIRLQRLIEHYPLPLG